MANISSLYSKEVQRKIAIRMVVSIAFLLTLITWARQTLMQLLGVTTAQLTAARGLALMLAAFSWTVIFPLMLFYVATFM